MSDPSSPAVAVIGGGPAGLMAAEILSRETGASVTIFERNASVGRKFLLAGRGGLNLTHSEDLDTFSTRYGPRQHVVGPLVASLTPADIRAWCEGLGQPTFVGSSGRIFPTAMKASGLLRAWLRRLEAQGVSLRTRHRWTGWTEGGELAFSTPAGEATYRADATVLAFGGASWPRLGSDGSWVEALHDRGVEIAPLQPANCGVVVPWSALFLSRFEGVPLKGVELSHDGQSARGEAIITATGMEGGPVYALSASVRQGLATAGATTVTVDLKPDVDHATLATQLGRPRAKQSLATFLRKSAHMAPVAIGLLQESAVRNGLRIAELAPDALAAAIKAVPLPVTGMAGIERAISTAGGVRFDAIDARLMLKQIPGVFVAGEMLDWEAPTGGYLLQACFATGAAAARGVRDWLAAARA